MKQKNSGVTWMFLLFGGIFFVVGMSLLISGIGVLRSTQKFLNRAEVIEGTISDIQVRYDSDGDAHHSVFVRYSYEGQEYETGLSEYSSSMHIGQSIRLYVDPRNPYSVRSKSMAYFLPIMLMGMGALFACVGLPFILSVLKKSFSRKLLLQNGNCVNATIVASDVNTHYSVNGRHPYYVDCQYRDPYSGMTYLYRSGHIWEDPYQFVGGQIPVYVDPKKPSKYYVAIEELQTSDPMIQDFR